MDDAVPDLAAFEAFLSELHAAAAAETLPRFRSADLGVDGKGGQGAGSGFDPVTAADRGAEAAIRRLIAARLPDHGVLGEEYGSDRADAEWVWVLDPVDGTRAFVAGLPLWVTLVGLRWRGRPVLGSIGQPYLDELYTGGVGLSARLRGRGGERPIRVRPCARLSEATVAATDPHAYMTGAELGAWTQVRAAARITRLGGDGYLFALVAAGAIDLVVESGLKPWDIEPCIPVIEAAGGAVTDWLGHPPDASGRIAAWGDRRVFDDARIALRHAP